MPSNAKPASEYTTRINREAVSDYAMSDREDFETIDRGFIAGFEGGRVVDEAGNVELDESDIAYITDDAPCPDTVNPSLWRQSQLNKRAGLYKVVDHLYQIRLSANVTVVDAPDGLVVIDTSLSTGLSKAGMELFRSATGNTKPVVAVILTHTHFDHYAGIKGVITAEDVASGKVPVIAPGTIESYNKHALGENIITGNAMSRRMAYTFGGLLERSATGIVSMGLNEVDEYNQIMSYIQPTDSITKTGEKRTLGGWEFEFLYAPDTEAPEEMHIWIPAIKALTCAENANHAMHNIQTIRGARTRDARNFARYLDETIVRWGDEAVVHFGPHTWPVWGNAEVLQFLADQRDMYKYIHDQALRLANQGLTPLEAAEQVHLPDALGMRWYNRFYHGGLHHNVRAVFHKELGFWDGDPATIWPLLPKENAQLHLDLIGRDKIMAEGRARIEAGDYRAAIQILHHAVFADPDDTEARELQADAYEQFGYQMEVPQYRHIFLVAALELRGGVQTAGKVSTVSLDTIMAMPMDLLFDYAAVHVIGEKAAETSVSINVHVTDIDERWTLWIARGVLNARKATNPRADLSIAGPKAAVTGFLMKPGSAGALIDKGTITATGDRAAVDRYAAVMDAFDQDFNIVTP